MTQSTDPSPADRLEQIARRPARLIPLICQMILGFALLIALVLKAYFVVLTDHQCVPEARTLGNQIRCTATFAIMANVLALSGGLELVRHLFSEGLARLVSPVLLCLGAAVLYLLSGLQDGHSWRDALVLVALIASLGAIAWIGRTLFDR